MRSRVNVKQQSAGGGSGGSLTSLHSQYTRGRSNVARSLDRKEDLKGRHFDGVFKSRRSHSFYYPKEKEEDQSKIISRGFFREEKFDDLSGCDKDLPMDFQELLQSPVYDESELKKRCCGQQMMMNRNNTTSFIQCGTNITSSIWSTDVPVMRPFSKDQLSSTSFQEISWKMPVPNSGEKNFSDSWYDIEGTSLSIGKEGNFFSSLIESSYSALNHNKNSSFTEVIPKPFHSEFRLIKASHPTSILMNDTQCTPGFEEDLLTSMRTHFRPIKQEDQPVSHNSSKPYTDGTTFVISTSLEDIKYRRSESGALYIGSEQKYMEYKEVVESPSEFIPKFRVRQNEKFCQTEDDSTPDEMSRNGYQEESYDCDLFFPGDESLLAEDMVSRLVDDEKNDESVIRNNNNNSTASSCNTMITESLSPLEIHNKIRVDGWLTSWPLDTSTIWRNVDTQTSAASDMSLFSGSKPWPTSEKECELLLSM